MFPAPWRGCWPFGLAPREEGSDPRTMTCAPATHDLRAIPLASPALQRPAFKTKMCKLEDAALILPYVNSNTATYLAYNDIRVCA